MSINVRMAHFASNPKPVPPTWRDEVVVAGLVLVAAVPLATALLAVWLWRRLK